MWSCPEVGNLLFSCSLSVVNLCCSSSSGLVWFGIESCVFFNLNCMFYDGCLLCNSVLPMILSGCLSFHVLVLVCEIYYLCICHAWLIHCCFLCFLAEKKCFVFLAKSVWLPNFNSSFLPFFFFCLYCPDRVFLFLFEYRQAWKFKGVVKCKNYFSGNFQNFQFFLITQDLFLYKCEHFLSIYGQNMSQLKLGLECLFINGDL
jgi:hypothetical protein